MTISIIDEPFIKTIAGFSGMAQKKDYAGTAFKLMDKMWRIVKSLELPNEGKNIWVYEANDMVFAGVELTGDRKQFTELETKLIHIDRYAWCKHMGAYQLIGKTGESMKAELQKQGLVTHLPYIEIYGHWTNDESKLETELLMSLD